MGSTRSGLLTPTSAVANDMLAAALSAPRYFASSAFASPTSDAAAVEPSTTRSHRAPRTSVILRGRNHHCTSTLISCSTLVERARIASEPATKLTATSLRTLLHAYAGRLALDASSCAAGAVRRDIRHVTDRAVKNLRFVHSAVLLLNFREVSDFHFCGIGVAT